MSRAERIGLAVLRLNDVVEFHYFRIWKRNAATMSKP
jgi:hypothetical protein